MMVMIRMVFNDNGGGCVDVRGDDLSFQIPLLRGTKVRMIFRFYYDDGGW